MGNLQISFAPMEGVTAYLYRNAHQKYFGGIDRYYSPFLTPNQNRKFSSREMKDVCPEHNQGICLIPQILTNNAEYFIWAAQRLKEMGYGEVNLNLGCPSGTVVSKGKGAGFLARRQELDLFLEQIFTGLEMDISVKTRIGKDSPEEFYELISIFNKYPMKELIIHPRIQRDFYKNSPNWEVFKDAIRMSRNPLCYNGDLFRVSDFERFRSEFPEIQSVMFGRGAIANPSLPQMVQRSAAKAAREKAGGEQTLMPEVITREKFKEFYEEIYHGYEEILSGERDVLFKMKELWSFWSVLFPSGERYVKKLKKAVKAADYRNAVEALFEEAEFDGMGGFV